MRHAYKSKYNLTCENQVILLMITDGEKWHYLAVKRLSALFRGITDNKHGDFYCLNCFQSYTTENKLKKHKKVCENHDYCYVEMPEECNEILKYNGLDHFKDPKAFMEYSDDMKDVYKNIENYNPGKKRKILILFDDMIADMINNKKLNPVVTELFIRGRKLNISIVFITQSCFKLPKYVRLYSTHFLSGKFQIKESFKFADCFKSFI